MSESKFEAPRDFVSAHHHAADKRKENKSDVEIERVSDVPPGLVKYIFDLQGRVEKEGRMDYHRYAELMWQEILQQDSMNTPEAFEVFEKSLIAGLHQIDMRQHVYESVRENLVPLIEEYGDSVKGVVLWSTGDVEATGYQVGKIERSRIIRDFYGALRLGTPDKASAKTAFRERTSYLVDDNKFDALLGWVEERRTEGEIMKIVIIEDSVKNFDKVRTALVGRYGEAILDRVRIFPIWATYSREGQAAERQAVKENKEQEFEKRKQELNAIGSFTELADRNRFGEILEGAYLLVDFDGVIGNNVSMRQDQAGVTYGSFLAGARQAGFSEAEIEEKIRSISTV